LKEGKKEGKITTAALAHVFTFMRKKESEKRGGGETPTCPGI